jgi:hypothetical protein
MRVQLGEDGQMRGVAPEPQAVMDALVKCGAEERLMKLPWVANCLRWILWKLASLAHQRPETRHHLLSWDVVLDELKKRSACGRCPIF